MTARARRRSWGSVTEVTRGKKYVIRWMENTPRGRMRRSKTIWGTSMDASRELALREVAHSTERRVPTIGEVYELWYLPWLERRLANGKIKQNTYDSYTATWKNVIAPKWSNVPIDSVKPQAYQDWLLSLNKGNASISVIVLRKALDIAVRNECIEHNVFRSEYDMPTTTTRKKKLDVYDIEQAESVLDKLHGTSIEVPFILACFGGCRVDESLAVKTCEVERIELDGVVFAAVSIKRQMGYTGHVPTADGELKTRASERIALIPEPYCHRLFDIMEGSSSEWTSDRGDGLPMNKSAFLKKFTALVGEESIPLSNLRASWRTFAYYTWNVPADTLEQLMGHALPGVSGQHYIRANVYDLAHSFATPYRAYLDAR